MKFLAFDTETGGITSDTSLLTVHFAVLDEQLNLIDELSLNLKPKDSVYHVTAEALNVNGIDIKQHDKIAITYEEGGTKLYSFIANHSNTGSNKLIPLGHNVWFDLQKVTENLLSKKTWNHFVSYRLMDLGVIGQFLKIAGKLPDTITGSLGSYCKHFEIQFDAHTAKGDTMATVACIKECLKLISPNTDIVQSWKV